MVYAVFMAGGSAPFWVTLAGGMAFAIPGIVANTLLFALAGPQIAYLLRRSARNHQWWAAPAGLLILLGASPAFSQELDVVPPVEIPPDTTAGAGSILPVAGRFYATFQHDGEPEVPMGERPGARYVSATRSYFETLEIPLLRGEMFTNQATRDSPGVMLVNEAAAREFWPDEDPVGQRAPPGRLRCSGILCACTESNPNRSHGGSGAGIAWFGQSRIEVYPGSRRR